MLSYDLAELYEVETRMLNQQVKRNIGRFPEKYMFQLTQNEYDRLRSHFVILKRGQRCVNPPGRTRNCLYCPIMYSHYVKIALVLK